MNYREFSGNYSEIGAQQGALLKARQFSVPSAPIDDKLAKQQYAIYQKHYPKMLEEILATATASGVDPQELVNLLLTKSITTQKRRAKENDKACTIFGKKSPNGLFVGRNYDWRVGTKDVFEIVKIINSESLDYFAMTDMDFGTNSLPHDLYYEYDDAINEAGLYIGLTFAYTSHWQIGLSATHMIKLIIETCSTVDQALQKFEKIPLNCPKNFFIADASGDMAVVEHTGERFKIIRPVSDTLIQTNHFLDHELLRDETIRQRSPENTTFARFKETKQSIDNIGHSFSFEHIPTVMTNIDSVTCQNDPAADMETVWTLALDMMEGNYTVYWDIFSDERKSMDLSFK